MRWSISLFCLMGVLSFGRAANGEPSELQLIDYIPLTRPTDTPTLENLQERALINAYAPTTVPCPSKDKPAIRDSTSLAIQEVAWLEKRRTYTIPAMRELLSRLNITGFDANAYFFDNRNNSELPNIAIAASGGGYRALMNGGGAVAAFDNRTDGSTGAGQLGGLLQSATYF